MNRFSLRVLLPSDATYDDDVRALRRTLQSGGLVAADAGTVDVSRVVREILEQVRRGGDRAVLELTERVEGVRLEPSALRVPAELCQQAHEQADAAFLQLVREAAANIRQYQEHILLKAPEPLCRGGRRLGLQYRAIDRVAVYVPGGKALYPSTVLMTVVPAQVAGVGEIVMISPPRGGEIHPLALTLAHELGVREVYRLGGAIGLAALAFGTESIRAVDKIVGPGNAYVAEAKRQLFGTVGIDSIAGPSEVVIVADDSVDPEWVAADLLAQAEHDPGAAILITPQRALAESVQHAVERQLNELERGAVARSALARYGAAIVSRSLEHACELANEFATEHLQLMTRDDVRCLAAIRHAGAIFCGAYTPVPLGDYFAGPSHVLPTGGTARFFGPLSANDFLKASSVISYDAASLAADAARVADFARREELTAHARAVEIRTKLPNGG